MCLFHTYPKICPPAHLETVDLSALSRLESIAHNLCRTSSRDYLRIIHQIEVTALHTLDRG